MTPAVRPSQPRTAPSTWPSPTGTAGSVRRLRPLNLGARAGRRRRGPRRPNLRLVLDDFAPGATPCRHAPGARRRRRRRRASAVRPTARTPTRWSPTAAGRRAAGPGRRLRAGPARRPDDRRRSAPSTPGAPGLAAGVVPATVERMRDLGASRRHAPGSARTSAAPATRCPPSCGPRSRRAVPASRAPPRRGARRPRPRRRGARPARARPASRSSTSRGCTREYADLYSYRRDGAAAGRLAGLIWIAARERRHERAAATSSPPTSTTVRGRIAAACARRRPRPRRGHPGRGHQVLPGLRRPAARRPRRHRRRREPPPGGRGKAAECADLDLRWHFIGGLQSNKAAAVARVRRRRRVRRPGQAGRPAATGRPRARPRRRRACSRSASTRRTPTGRSGAEPGRPARLAAAVEEAGMLRLRGLMAVAPLGEDPRAGLRPARRDPPRTSSPTTPTPPGSRPA